MGTIVRSERNRMVEVSEDGVTSDLGGLRGWSKSGLRSEEACEVTHSEWGRSPVPVSIGTGEELLGYFNESVSLLLSPEEGLDGSRIGRRDLSGLGVRGGHAEVGLIRET